jgi:prophage antirepressor-like protein
MENKFYLDVYSELLKFNDKQIFIVFDENDEIWFKYGDVLNVLGYIDIKNAIKDINLNEKYIKSYSDIKGRKQSSPSHPMTKMINNNGLFMLLSLSKKDLAKQFMKQYIDEIMPKITKTGKYISSKEDMDKIKLLNKNISKLRNKVNNLKDENNFLGNKHRYQPSSNGYAYINQTTSIVKGKRQKSYKFGLYSHRLVRD